MIDVELHVGDVGASPTRRRPRTCSAWSTRPCATSRGTRAPRRATVFVDSPETGGLRPRDRGQWPRVRPDGGRARSATRAWPTCAPAWRPSARPSSSSSDATGTRIEIHRPADGAGARTQEVKTHDRGTDPTADAAGGRRPRGRPPGPRRRCSTAGRSSRSSPRRARSPSRSRPPGASSPTSS